MKKAATPPYLFQGCGLAAAPPPSASVFANNVLKDRANLLGGKVVFAQEEINGGGRPVVGLFALSSQAVKQPARQSARPRPAVGLQVIHGI